MMLLKAPFMNIIPILFTWMWDPNVKTNTSKRGVNTEIACSNVVWELSLFSWQLCGWHTE